MSITIKASELALVGFWDFLHTLLANLGEDFSSQKQTSSGTATHEKPPLPLGMLLKFASLIAIGVCCSLVFLAVSVSRALRVRCLADPSQFWYYFLGVVPTKIMVLSNNQDDTEVSRLKGLAKSGNNTWKLPKPKIWHLRRQISHFRFNLLRPSDRDFIVGSLHAFMMFNWVSDTIVRALPISSSFHKSVVYVLLAILLCPLQLLATSLSMRFPPLFSPSRAALNGQGLEKEEKAPSSPTVKEPKKEKAPSQPGAGKKLNRVLVKQLFLALLSIYCWLFPITLLWATACELAKVAPLALSRTYSLKDRAQWEALFAISGSSLCTLLSDSALVFLVYVASCLVFILPTSIAMRRIHASLHYFSNAVVPPDESIRGRTLLAENKYLGVFEALRTFSSRQAARMVLLYGTAYCVMQVIKSVGFIILMWGVQIVQYGYGPSEQYMGFWETIGWFFRRVLFRN